MIGKKVRDVEDYITVKASNERIKRIEKGAAARYLGVWIEEELKNKAALQLLREDLDEFIEKMAHKKITITQACYINNAVFVPLVNYHIQHMILTENQVNKL